MTERQQRAALALHKAQVEFTAAFAEDAMDRATRWRLLLTMVEAAGGTVTSQEWADMGRACGYDPRGLGGFHRGDNPTMVQNADGSHTLTAAGVAYLDRAGRLS